MYVLFKAKRIINQRHESQRPAVQSCGTITYVAIQVRFLFARRAFGERFLISGSIVETAQAAETIAETGLGAIANWTEMRCY